MIKTFNIFLIIVLSMLPRLGYSISIVPYANYTGNSPGATYDIGTLIPTDLIKVQLSWITLVDYNNLPSISLYSVTDTNLFLIPLNYGEISYPTSTSLIYLKTADRYSKFYIVVEIGSNGG